MLSVAEAILNVAKSLLGMSDQLRSADRQRRHDMADLFGQVSECLADTSAVIRKGEIPHGRCAELLTYAQDLPRRIDRELGPQNAGELGRQLAEAHTVEKLASELSDLPDKEPYLAALDEAAGKLRALANLVRVGCAWRIVSSEHKLNQIRVLL